ncbi:MAG: carbonic anhydrase family protein [Chitinophagales bacterium]|jgi:carbonic anhydrase|nr:carbonic anhydrase family protein [Chitinophagales bacterium]
MKKLILIFLISLLVLSSCEQKSSDSATSPSNSESKPLVQSVLTKEQRDAMTPDEIIQSLKEGNQRFVSNTLTARDHSEQVRKSALGQFPKAVILSCLDSRVPVEDVFDRGIGDMFVGRVAGNFVNEDLLGSMEFGCKVAGAKVIMILGHEHCGAVKSAIDDVKLGNITAMLSKIKPAIAKVTYNGEKTSKNEEFVHQVCESNVRHAMSEISAKSPILKELIDSGQLRVIGGVYDMDSGKVTFLE